MNKILLFSLFSFSIFSLYGQRLLCDECDSMNTMHVRFDNKAYRTFKKGQCNLDKYSDSKKTKKLYCEAKYYSSIGQSYTSIDLLNWAYIIATSNEFKFQILKLTTEVYKKLGDNRALKIYQDKVDEFLEKFPDIEK